MSSTVSSSISQTASVFRIFFALLCAALLGACATSSNRVSAIYDKSTEFGPYKTFGFYEPLGTERTGIPAYVSEVLKSATRAEMESRGYVHAGSEADLMINFNAHISIDKEISPALHRRSYYFYRQDLYPGWDEHEVYVDEFKEGTLNVDIVDAELKRLVWEGIAVGRVRDRAREPREAAIREAVSEVFAEYPFRADD